MWRNPFYSEAGAFRLVLLTVVAFAAVAVAALASGATAALSVWAFVSAAVIVLLASRLQPTRTLRTAPAHVGPPGERCLIVLAQATLPAKSLDEVGRRADRVVVISAASSSFVHRWLSDIDGEREQAGRRVEETVGRLRASHVDATGAVGDDDPVRAIEDALREFGGDEIVVATGRGAHDAAVAARVRQRFALPVMHLVA
jgi:GABA permease